MATASVKHLYTGTTTGVLYTDRREFYIKPAQFDELYKDVTPLLTLASRDRKTGLKDPVYKMFQHKNPWQRQYMVNNGSTITIAAGSTGAAAESNAVTFDGITGLNATIDTSYVHLVFEVWDSDLTTKRGTVILTDDTSGTTAKFRNLTQTAISTVDNDVFVCISNAQEDGSEAPDAWSDDLSVVWNQTQQIKTAIEIQGDLYYAALKGANNELARLRAQKIGEHKMHIEGALKRGSSLLGTNLASGDTFTDLDKLVGDNSKVVRTTMGYIPAVELYGNTSGDSQNRFDVVEATYTYSNFVDDMEKVFQYGDSFRYALCGGGALSYWSKKAMDKNSGWDITISGMQKDSVGFNVKTLETPHGDLKLVRDRGLKYELNNYMLIPDDKRLSLYEYRPTKFMANIKTDNAYDGEKDQYFSQPGLGMTHIETHNIMVIK